MTTAAEKHSEKAHKAKVKRALRQLKATTSAVSDPHLLTATQLLINIEVRVSRRHTRILGRPLTNPYRPPPRPATTLPAQAPPDARHAAAALINAILFDPNSNPNASHTADPDDQEAAAEAAYAEAAVRHAHDLWWGVESHAWLQLGPFGSVGRLSMSGDQRTAPHHIGERLTPLQLAPALLRQLRVVPSVRYISHIQRTGRPPPEGLHPDEMTLGGEYSAGVGGEGQGHGQGSVGAHVRSSEAAGSLTDLQDSLKALADARHRALSKTAKRRASSVYADLAVMVFGESRGATDVDAMRINGGGGGGGGGGGSGGGAAAGDGGTEPEVPVPRLPLTAAGGRICISALVMDAIGLAMSATQAAARMGGGARGAAASGRMSYDAPLERVEHATALIQRDASLNGTAGSSVPIEVVLAVSIVRACLTLEQWRLQQELDTSSARSVKFRLGRSRDCGCGCTRG